MISSSQIGPDEPSRTRLLGPLCLLGMVAIFFSPFLLAGKTFLLRDLWFFFYPGYVFYRESLLEGHLPLWNHYFACGEPFLADVERGVFYPLNLIYLILPVGHSMTILSAIHILLAGWGTYALARVWRLSVPASVFAAVGYAFSTATMTRIEFPSFLTGVAWYPVVLAAYARWLDGRNRWALLGTVVAVLMQCVGCCPEAILFTAVSVCLYAVTSAGCVWRANGGWRASAAPLAGMVISLSLGMGLAAVQLLPMREAMNHSRKGGGVSSDLVDRMPAIRPDMLAGFVLPSIHGVQGGPGKYWAPTCTEFWQGTGYVGVLPWIIFVWVLVARIGGRQPEASSTGVRRCPYDARFPFLLLQLVLFLLYAMGRYSPLYNALWYMFALVRTLWCAPKSMMCVVLALACLSGMGLDWLVTQGLRAIPGRRKWVTQGVVLCLSGLAVACLIDHGRWGEWLLRRCFNLGSVEAAFAHRIPWGQLARDVVKLAVVALSGGLVLTFVAVRPRAGTFGAWCLVALSFGEMALTDVSLFPAVRPDVLERPSPLKGRLQPEPGPVRYWVREGSMHLYGETSPELFQTIRDALLWSWPTVDHAFAVGSATIFEVADITYLRALTDDGRLPASIRRRLLSILNCGVFVQLPDMRKYFTSGALDSPRPVDLPAPLPRAYVVGGVEVVGDMRSLYERLLDPAWDPQSTTVVERRYFPGESCVGLRPGRVEHRVTDIRYVPNGVELKVWSERDGLLVLSDTYYDGWIAVVNGQGTPVFKANGAFRGVRVRKGENVIRMDYRPEPLRLGAIVSLAAFVLTVGAVVVSGRRPRWLGPGQ